MTWNFRKKVKVIPGVYLNFSRKGITTTIGPRGLSLNIGKADAFVNATMPGTGLSVRKSLSDTIDPAASPSRPDEIADRLRYLLEKTYDGTEQIRSEPISQLTSKGLKDLKEIIITAHKEYADISALIKDVTGRKQDKDRRLANLQRHIFRFLYKKRIERYSMESDQMQKELDELMEQQKLSTVDLHISNDDTFSDMYGNIRKACQLILSCEKVWDITTSKEIDRIRLRSAAGTEVNRVVVKALIETSDIIQMEDIPLKLQNKNGGDLFFFPGFVIIHEQAFDFAILDYSEFDIEFRTSRFVEEEVVPADTETVGRTWAKVNKDGSPDKRFANNYQIPIVHYGEITFTSATGIHEKYLFSNAEYARLFYTALKEYIKAIKSANAILEEFNR